MALVVEKHSTGGGPLLGRDHRLDFWRGLCLVDMVLVHLVYENLKLGQVLTLGIERYTRFAAGGFIFLAGLGVSYIFLHKVQNPATRVSAYQALFRRSLYLLLVHYATSLSFVIIWMLRDYAGPFPSPWEYAQDVLLFREGCDLLLFYVTMVALAPGMLELIRRGYGWALAVLSISLFTLGQWYPYALSLPIQTDFSVLLWQFIFIMGMLAGSAMPAYDRLSFAAKAKFVTLAWCAVGVIASADFGGWGARLGIVFRKCPLSPGEAARYIGMIVAIASTTDLFWQRIAQSGFVAFFRSMGKRSLAIYVAHIWVVALVMSAAHRAPWLEEWQALFAPVAVAMLWSWSCVLDTLEQGKKKLAEQPWLGTAFWRISGASAASVIVLFGIYAALPGPAGDRSSAAFARVTPPANLAGMFADATDSDSYGADDLLPDLPNEDVMPDDAAV